MELRRYNLLLLLVILASTAVHAQTLKFEKILHDFGTIAEDGGKVSTEFHFVNKGKLPTAIYNIAVSCGCTSPKYPSEAIAPGDSGVIQITFDPMDRPGKFEKFIGVESDNSARVILKIVGEVTPRPEGPRDWYPSFLGNLWFKQSTMFVGSVFHDTTATYPNVVYNASDEPITLKWAEVQLPGDFVSLEYKEDQEVLAAGDSTHFTLIYSGEKRNDWGYLIDSLYLPTSDSPEDIKALATGAIINERFREGEPTAKFEVDRKEHAFGSVAFGSKVDTVFTITNTGKAPLFIRKATSTCGCIEAEYPKEGIPAGESAEIKLTLDTSGQMGWMRKLLTLVTNDPKKSFQNLILKADVRPPTGN